MEVAPPSDRATAILQWILAALKTLSRGLIWLFAALYGVLAGLVRHSALLFLAITNYQNRRKAIIEEWRRHWRSRKENFRQFPLITKVILTIIILTVCGFIIGVQVVRSRARQTAELAAYQGTLTDIRAKRDAAESNLIYKNEPAALSELQSAQTLLNSLPCTSKEEKTNCDNLKSELERIAVRLRKVTNATAELVASLPSLTSSTVSMVRLDNKVLFSGNTDTAVMQYDLTSKNISMIASTPEPIYAMTAPKENDFVLLESVNHALYKLDPKTNTVSSTLISFPQSNAFSSLTIYNRRLYTLDPVDNQIYRHTTIRDGYDIGREWIKTTGVNLQNAVDMTVDGDMYVLGSTGAVTKFTTGEKQNDFTLAAIDPPLTSANRIYTYTDVNNLYILDTTGKRIIIVDKTGQLKQQITADQFVRPTDFIIDEPGRSALVIDSGKLYKVPLTF